MSSVRSYFQWLRTNDPLGASFKGAILGGFGVVLLAAGHALLGVILVAVGFGLGLLPVVLVRRDGQRVRRWPRR